MAITLLQETDYFFLQYVLEKLTLHKSIGFIFYI